MSVQTGCTSTVLNAQRMTEGISRWFPRTRVLKHVECEYFKREEVTTRTKIRKQEKKGSKRNKKLIKYKVKSKAVPR